MKFNSSLGKAKPSQHKPTTAIYSAALQDHFLKKFTSSIDVNFSTKKELEKPKTTKKLPSLPTKMD